MANAERVRLALLARRDDLMITDDEWEQLEVLLEAFGVYIDREKHYHGLWKEGGTADALFHLKSKLARLGQDRILTADERQHNFQNCHDTQVDIINFAAFHLRHTRAGRFTD